MKTAFDTETLTDLHRLWSQWTAIDADHAAQLARAYDDAMLREAWTGWKTLDDEHAGRLAESLDISPAPYRIVRAA